MSGWRKRDEQSSGQNGQRQAGAVLPQTVPIVPPAPVTPLVLSDTSTPSITSPEPALGPVPQFCPECGGRLNSTAVYVPKFCTLCGHYLVGAAALGSGLDALLQATSAAMANGTAAGDADAPGSNVTLMGGSQTLMGAPRTQLYTQTLMGVSRSDLYNPPPVRARTGSTRAPHSGSPTRRASAAAHSHCSRPARNPLRPPVGTAHACHSRAGSHS